MNTLKDYVNWKLTHSDKIVQAEGYPLVLENCKKNKKMKDLKVYGYIGKNLIWGKGSLTRETCTMSCSGSEITLNGACSSNMSFRSSPYTESQSITLKANTKYIFSVNYISGTMVSCSNGFGIGLYSQDVKWLINTSRYTSNYKNTWSKAVTVTEDTKVSLYCVGQGEFENLTFGIQVEEGSAATEYEPYEEKFIGEKTKNLYDAKTYPLDKNDFVIWSGSGAFGYNVGMTSTSSYIPCVELRGKTITISGNSTSIGSAGIAFYGENQTYVSGYGYRGSVHITCTVPDNASFYRFCVSSDYKETAMIIEGSSSVPYEPYDKYKIPIVQRGKNVLDLTKRSYSNASNQQTLDNGIIVKGSISSSTSPTLSSKGWFIVGRQNDINYIKNKIDAKITISLDITLQERLDETITPQTLILLNQALASPSYTLELGVKKHISRTFTPKSEWEDLYFVICLCSQVLKLENIQVEYGSTETPYEPYVEPITHDVFINEPLANGEELDVKEYMQLPILTTKTTIFEIDSTIQPSNMYGKYIK